MILIERILMWVQATFAGIVIFFCSIGFMTPILPFKNDPDKGETLFLGALFYLPLGICFFGATVIPVGSHKGL